MIGIDIEIQNIGIVGAGVMGTSIANVFASSGYRVMLNDINEKNLDAALGNIEVYLAGGISRKKISNEDKAEILKRIRITSDIKEFNQADIIIEAVDEDYKIKEAVLKRIDEVIEPHTIVATNTNSLSITKIAQAISNPSRVAGMHFLQPSESMKLVEVTYGEETSRKTVSIIKEVVNNLNKEVVVIAKDTSGHIVNRILMPLIVEAIKVYEAGIATKEDIDKAVRYGLNHPMGPFELQDFIGLDVCYNLMKDLAAEFDDATLQPPSTLKKLVDAGHIGRKVGKGYYNYTI